MEGHNSGEVQLTYYRSLYVFLKLFLLFEPCMYIYFFYMIQAGEEHAKSLCKQNAHAFKEVIENSRSAVI